MDRWRRGSTVLAHNFERHSINARLMKNVNSTPGNTGTKLLLYIERRGAQFTTN
jgi:hypothetical protein